MDSLHRHIMGFGSISESNPQSMHYKYIKLGDEIVPARVSPCYCPLINQSRGFDEEFVNCEFCKEAEKELKIREGLYETAKGTPISKLKQIEPHYKNIENCKNEKVNGIYPFITCIDCGKAIDKKPHYKWSWKLNKAVRL